MPVFVRSLLLVFRMEVEKFNNFLRDLDDLDAFNNVMGFKVLKRRCSYAKSSSFRKKRFNPMIEFSDYEFKQKYRYTKENINKIIEIIRDDLELERPMDLSGNSNQVPIEMQVLIALRRWGLNEGSKKLKNLLPVLFSLLIFFNTACPSGDAHLQKHTKNYFFSLPELLADIHFITVHTLEKICRRIAGALSSKASRYIRMPATLAEKEQVTKNFNAIAGFPQVIGAVSSQSFRLRKIIKSNQEFSSSSNCECTMNIQIISDASLKIRDFDYKLRPLSRSLYKIKQIFPETRIKERFEQNEFRGRLLLGNAAYTCTNYFYTPVSLQRNASLKEVAFNKSHKATHAPVKLCQEFLQNRFSILQSEIVCTSFNNAKHLVLALAVLHNIAIDLEDSCSEFTDDFGLSHFSESATKYLNDRGDIEDCGLESRSIFISKYF